MNFPSALELTKPSDLCLEIPQNIQTQIWSQSQNYATKSSCWRAYLNQICTTVFLQWLREEELYGDCRVKDETMSAQLWEFINGTAIQLDKQCCILIPSDAIDTSELRVPQEWVDIPDWVPDYYLAVQIDTEDNFLRVWGWTTHKQLKEAGNYNRRTLTYALDREQLVADLSALWVARELFTAEQTRSEVVPLDTLSLDRANELIEKLSNPEVVFPRREVSFAEWSALLANKNLRQILAQNRLTPTQAKSPSKLTHLSQWLEGAGSQGWQTIADIFPSSPTQLTPVFRDRATDNDTQNVQLIDLQVQLREQSLALLVGLKLEEEGEVSIRVQLSPVDRQEFLPPNLKLTLLSESGKIVRELETGNRDRSIQLPRWKSQPGKQFNLRISWEDLSLTEKFQV